MTRFGASLLLCAAVTILAAAPAGAQVRPAPEYTPPDDNPSVRVGGTLFADYTYTLAPDGTTDDGRVFNPHSFNVTRAYLNVSGQLNHLFAFRITPDVVRETGAGSALNGRMTVDLKYAYLQFNLDDWLWRNSYVRAGMTQTPFIDFEESIYRYRFQGPVFAEREGYLLSSDYGVAFHTQFPRGYGDATGGVYNGEGFTHFETNDQKALVVRGTFRPFPNANAARGLRVTMFHDNDHYSVGAERRRSIGLVTFEHRFVNLAGEYLSAADRATPSSTTIDSSGLSLWATPRLQLGPVPVAPPAGVVRASLEGLVRYDRRRPDDRTDSAKDRWIAGVAYWPSMRTASVAAAFLLDYEQVHYHQFTAGQPSEKRIAVHMLVNF